MPWFRRRRGSRLKIVAVEKGLEGYRSPHDRVAVLGKRLETVPSGTIIEWRINDLRFLLGDLYHEHAELRERLRTTEAERDAALQDTYLPENRFRLEFDWATGRLHAQDGRPEHFRPLGPSGLLEMVGYVLRRIREDEIREAEEAVKRATDRLASMDCDEPV